MRVQRQRGNSRFGPLVKILISLVLLVGVSFMLAWVWHTTQQSAVADNRLTPGDLAADASSQPQPESPAVVGEPSRPPESSQDSKESSDASTDQDAKPAPSSIFTGALPETPPVDNSYFDDAIFIGDSISTGIPLYHLADNAAVVAMTGLQLATINELPVIDVGEEERVTVLEACKRHPDRKKVYIMLGGNSLGLDKNVFISRYKTFVDSVQELYPGAVFYLQSITPVVEGYQNEFVPDIDNAKIDSYNLEIMALAEREKVHYLDVASVLKDETGALPLEASPTDGMHFSPEYYTMWFTYLKNHAVEVKK